MYNFNSGMLTGITDISVYYHADCTDGLLAAAACFNWHSTKLDKITSSYLSPISKFSIEFVPYDYSMIPKKLGKGDLLILLDFSFSLSVITKLLDDGVRICILDHHAPRVEELKHLIEQGKIWGILNTAYSGSVLAYGYFRSYGNGAGEYSDTEGGTSTNAERAKNLFHKYVDNTETKCYLPELLKFAQDRDLWTKKYPETDFIMLGFYETVKDIKSAASYLDLNLPAHHIEKLEEAGRMFTKVRDSIIKEALDHKFTISFTGESGKEYSVQCVNLPESFRTSACIAQHNDHIKVAGSLTILPNGLCKVSLRSVKPITVNDIALDMGGGGHPQAAGFETSLANIRFDDVSASTTNKFESLVDELHDYCDSLDSRYITKNLTVESIVCDIAECIQIVENESE